MLDSPLPDSIEEEGGDASQSSDLLSSLWPLVRPEFSLERSNAVSLTQLHIIASIVVQVEQVRKAVNVGV